MPSKRPAPEPPEPLSPLVDAHTHLDACGATDAESVAAVVDRAAAVGVGRVVTVADDLAAARFAVEAAHWDQRVYAAVALHPTRANALDDAAEAELEKLAADPRVVAVGETGLDYYWPGKLDGCATIEDQVEGFRWHIDLAKRVRKPLMIHNREADHDLLAVLLDEGAPDTVIFHCFSSDTNMAIACVEEGYVLSFSGTVIHGKLLSTTNVPKRKRRSAPMSQDLGMSPFIAPDVPEHLLDTVRVFLYARQSKGRSDGSDVSTEAQLAAGRALVASRNAQGGARWVVAGEFVDVGRSGWDPNVTRADFERMMGEVRAGEGDVVVVNELSRLTRKGAHDALEIDNELKKHGVRFMSVLEPFLDTSTPIGVAIFALIAALAKQDSDLKAERLKGAKDEIAALGGVHSSSAPFGMRAVRKKVDNLVISVLEPDEDNPDHVELVERMAKMSFEGVSDNAIATTFEKEKIPSPGMAERRATEKRLASIKARRLNGAEKPIMWRAQTVRWILNHPAIGGFAFERVKHGKAHINVIRRDPGGKPLTPHTGILSGSKWLELQEKRSGKNLSDRKPGAEVEPTLLSGWRFLGCRICGGSMGQSQGGRKRNGDLAEGNYMCANPKGHGGLSVKRSELDEFVASKVWARLRTADMEDEHDQAWIAAAAERFALQHDLAGVADERREQQAHLDNVRRSIKDLQADRKAGLYVGREELETWRSTVLQYRSYEAECTTRLAELDEKMNGSTRVPSEWFSGEDPTAEGGIWASWDVYERREFLSFFLDSVMVDRGRHPETKKYIPLKDRVTLKWAELLKEEDEASEATERELAAL